MTSKAFQDYYPDDVSHCYGCGRLNPDGLQIKSYWEGEESVCPGGGRHGADARRLDR